jgi:hypothetical protein
LGQGEPSIWANITDFLSDTRPLIGDFGEKSTNGDEQLSYSFVICLRRLEEFQLYVHWLWQKVSQYVGPSNCKTDLVA